MTALHLVIAVLVFILFIYLLIALFKAEWF